MFLKNKIKRFLKPSGKRGFIGDRKVQTTQITEEPANYFWNLAFILKPEQKFRSDIIKLVLKFLPQPINFMTGSSNANVWANPHEDS